MPRQSAIRFAHHAGFVDYVCQTATAPGDGRWALHACDDPEGLGEVYFLTHDGDPEWLRQAAARGWTLCAVEVDERAGRVRAWRDGERTSLTYPLKAHRGATRLPLLVGPVDAQEDARPGDHVVIWCRQEAAFQRLIGMSLRLGCDRLQFVTIRDDAQGAAFLLRAERLSYYVIDVALEDPETQVYVPNEDGGLFVEWGAAHPLSSRLMLGDDDSSGIMFMSGRRLSATLRRVHLPAWKDVYQLTRFELAELTADERWGEAGASPDEFVVKLRLSPAHMAREPHVWLLPQREQARVERLLHAIPEPDLDNLQFTAQESDDGERYLLIRERHTGIGREYIDFEGVQLGPYAGYPNLMLPIDSDLEPQLRKDRYRSLFDLQPGKLTVLWEAQGRLRLVHLQERSFQPLRAFVDYIIGAEGEELNQMLARTVFDFADYRFAAPAHQPARQGRQAPRRPVDDVINDDMADESVEEEAATQATRPDSPNAPVQLTRPNRAEEPEPGELEAREAALESEVVFKGQRLERWRALAQVKQALGKHREAAVCWLEALWMTQGDAESSEALSAHIISALERSEEISLRGSSPTERSKKLRDQVFKEDSDPGWIWLWITHGARYLRANPGAEQTHVWITEGNRLLTARADALRKKERWLLWGQIIGVNQDAVVEARVREELVEELNDRGLRPIDVPQFIQNRIYQSRLIDEGEVDGGSEARIAMGILERIQEEVGRAEDDTLRLIGDAVLSYGFQRLGDHARAAQLAANAERAFNKPLNTAGSLTGIEKAWVALYLGAAQELTREGAGQEWLTSFERLFKQHRTGDLYSSELETLQRHLLERVSAESPTRFLDAENFRSLYPSSQKYTKGQALRHDLESMVQRGEFDKTLASLQNIAGQASTRSLGLDTRQLAWLLHHVIIKTMRRIGRAAEGGGILEKFEKGRIDPSEDTMGGFYPTLYMLALGEGFLDLGQERRGMDLICGAVRGSWQPEPRLQWLDHLDMLSAALAAIETAPLGHRIDAVSEVLQALFMDRKHRSDRPQYRPIKLRLLDHCLEVGLSKERLSLKRYKNYMEEDEFYVRQRIIREKLT